MMSVKHFIHHHGVQQGYSNGSYITFEAASELIPQLDKFDDGDLISFRPDGTDEVFVLMVGETPVQVRGLDQGVFHTFKFSDSFKKSHVRDRYENIQYLSGIEIYPTSDRVVNSL